MCRNFGIGFLILCFGFSNINLGWAAGTMEVAPIVVQPYEIQALNQQMIDRDRQNRDAEIAIKGLVEDNNKLTQAALGQQNDEGLAKINQTMLNYSDALTARDRARIVANGENWRLSRYRDLIALTRDADSMTVRQDIENESGLLTAKYQMLTELKDEMTTLNQRLSDRQKMAADQIKANMAEFKRISQEQQGNVQMIVVKLGEMDKKIAHLEDIIAEKDRQILQLKDNLAMVQSESSLKDETIKEQENQIAVLKEGGSKGLPPSATNNVVLPQPVAPESNFLLADKEDIIKQQGMQLSQKQGQIDLLKSELEVKIAQENNQGPKDETIKEQANQITALNGQSRVLSSNEEIIKSQARQMAQASEQMAQAQQQIAQSSAQFNEQRRAYADLRTRFVTLRNEMQVQSADLKAKDESIHWLNQVLDAAKNKAKYYQLTARQDQLTMAQFQKEVQDIKDGFARHFKDYDQFEDALVSLKSQVGRLGQQLSFKESQVELLKSELENASTQEKKQGLQESQEVQAEQAAQAAQASQTAQAEQQLKVQLQDKEDQIVKMKTDIQDILQDQFKKETNFHNATLQMDDHINLAKKLIDLQEQESVLLEEKSDLEAAQISKFDQQFLTFDNKMKGSLLNRQFQDADLKNRMEELKNILDQKKAQADLLEAQLRHKIAEEKNQDVLAQQIQDLNAQLQDREEQIAAMKKEIQAGQKTQEELDSLKQQLSVQQDNAGLLKQQLDSKTAQADQTTVMMGEYQKKLESQGSALNEELKQVLSSQRAQALMEAQIADLSTKLHQKEAQIVKIEKDMYDLQESDLSLSTELALDRKKLAEHMTSIDEINFLRTGYKKATALLKQKDDMLAQIKADADEYQKEFKEQSKEFQSLKDQLQEARDEISRRNEDLRYKNMEIIRLKERAKLSSKGNAVTPPVGVMVLPNSSLGNSPLEDKLKQALDKIDEQGRAINTLVQKLQDCGQSVNLTKP